MNYELFNGMLNRLRMATNSTEVEEIVGELHRLTDHADYAERIRAEQAIMAARKKCGSLPRDTKANSTQVAGNHYRTPIQHWDWVAANNLGYFEGQITKYVCRWRKKNGVQDLHKARHFLDKLIELQEEEDCGPTSAYVDQ